MASHSATLAVKITADARDAARGLDDVGKKAGGFSSGLNKAAATAAVAGAALLGFGKQAFDAASSAEQAAGAVDAAFGSSAAAIHAFAKTSATSVGLASGDYEAMAATFGAQLKNMGVSADKLAPTTNNLVGLGADLAAQFGGTTADAVEALGALLRGETDPIEKYGVSIKQADIAAQKAKMGLKGLTGQADKAATTQATLALLTQQTADATGAFGREADTAAGQQQRANAQFKDAEAALGAALLPVVSALAAWMGKLAGFVKDNKAAFTALGAVVASVAAVILGIKAATLAWQAAQMIAKGATLAWQAAQWLLNAAMTANPIGIVVVAIGALIAGIVLLVKNWDKVTAAFKWTWDWLKKNWPMLLGILTGPFGAAVVLIIKNWDTIKSWFAAFGRWIAGIFNSVKAVAASVFRAIGNVVGSVLGAIRGTANAVFGAIRTALGAVRSVAGAVAGAIRAVLVGAFNAVRAVAASVFGAVRAAIETVRSVASSIATSLRNVLAGAFNAVSSAGRSAFNALLGPINAVASAIGWVISKVESLIGWISRIHFPDVGGFLGKIGGIVGLAAPAPPSPAGMLGPTPTVAGFGAAGTRRAIAGAGGITINVTGALDPDAVARQIQRILTARARRVGGVRIGAA